MSTQMMVDVDAFDVANLLIESADFGAEAVNQVGRTVKDDVRATWARVFAAGLDDDGRDFVKALAASLGE